MSEYLDKYCDGCKWLTVRDYKPLGRRRSEASVRRYYCTKINGTIGRVDLFTQPARICEPDGYEANGEVKNA